MLKNLNKDGNNIKKKDLTVSVKREKVIIKDNNINKNGNTNKTPKKVVLNIQLTDDAAKKGISLRSFEKIDIQYQYSYGKVYKVIFIDNNDNNTKKKQTLIFKKIKKRDIYRNRQLKNVENEINLITQCDCPFILKILYSFQDKKNIYMVEDYCPGGNLKWHINSNLFEEDEAKFYIAELILAIEYLHKRNIYYKNLQSEKILINEKNHIQLIGYGLINETIGGKNKNEDENIFFGLQDEYISPELLTLRGEEKMSDLYGIGVVLYEMVCGTKPFYSKESINLFNNDFNKKKLMMNEYFSMELKNLLIKLLCKDPKDRIGAQDIDEIKKHSFFKDIDWNKLGKMQIVPPINLVKNKLENNNKISFKKKNKNEQKDYYLDFHIIKKVDNFTFNRKNVHNKVDDIILIKEKNESLNNIKEGIVYNENKNENILININENYIEGPEQKEKVNISN